MANRRKKMAITIRLSVRPVVAVFCIFESFPSFTFLRCAILPVSIPAEAATIPPKKRNPTKEDGHAVRIRLVTISPSDNIPRIRLVFASRAVFPAKFESKVAS
jgi:hypothetical protein